jgi:hypothetical protein
MKTTGNSVLLPPTSEAPASPHGDSLKWTGTAAASVSVLASLAIINWCLHLGLDYADQINPRCGTGCARVWDVLTSQAPVALLGPYLGWYTSLESRVGVPVARCAALAAHAAWLTVLLIVSNFHF